MPLRVFSGQACHMAEIREEVRVPGPHGGGDGWEARFHLSLLEIDFAPGRTLLIPVTHW